ncbi:hypothetical protein CANMA_005007 [Candida margitis]|uniref:uncharacterized protein n=1 Tax=Candida margitis TaxID=1775924 RepID=UPI002225C50D|nr:uncharacterized protein CANMA_005007 [Candida margitis]KAI5953092.1 hypothetical protein CANMA_005007 [Candida margitis]
MDKPRHPIKKICQIPEIQNDRLRATGGQYRTKTFLLVLRIIPFDKNRCIIEATDFTSNHQISEEIGEDEKEYKYLRLDENKVLRAVAFNDKVQSLNSAYKEAFPPHTLSIPDVDDDRDSSVVLDDRLLILGMTLKWRTFRGIFEPYVYDPDIVEWEYLTEYEKPVVSDLYKKILKKRQYIKALNGLEKVIIPQQFINNMLQDDDDDVSQMTSFDEESDEEAVVELVHESQTRQDDAIASDINNAAESSGRAVYSIERDLSQEKRGNDNNSELARGFDKFTEVLNSNNGGSTKNEQISSDFGHKRAISGLGYEEAAKRSRQDPSSPDENDFCDPQPQTSSVKKAKDSQRAELDNDEEFTTISKLIKLNNTVDNKVYAVICEVLHATPTDKELLSYKSCEVNPLTGEMELSHTRLQGIEFIVTDVAKPKNYELQEGEYLSIYLDGEQVLALSQSSGATKRLLNFAWDNARDDTIITLNLRKVQREALVWTIQ